MNNNRPQRVDPFTAQLAARMAQQHVIEWQNKNKLPLIRLQVISQLMSGGLYETVEYARKVADEIIGASDLLILEAEGNPNGEAPGGPSLDGVG